MTTITDRSDYIAEQVERITATAHKCFAHRGESCFVQIGKVKDEFVLSLGWEVQERDEDDYLCMTAKVFKNKSKLAPWIGREYKFATAKEAAEMYDAAKISVYEKTFPRGGTVIGSVRR